MQHSSQCLDAETFAALLSGDLAPDPLRAAEAHLVHCKECRSGLADAAAALHPPESTGPHSTRADGPRWPVPGDLIAGKYRIEEWLGQGAMSVVHAARELEGPRVAIKILSSREPTAAARLIREARTCARL